MFWRYKTEMEINKFIVFSFLIWILILQMAVATPSQKVIEIAEDRIQLSCSPVQTAIYREFVIMLREGRDFVSLGNLSLQLDGDSDSLVLWVYWMGFLTPYGVSLSGGAYDDEALTRPVEVLFPDHIVSLEEVLLGVRNGGIKRIVRVYAQLSPEGSLLALAGEDYHGYRVDPSRGTWLPAYLIEGDDFRLVFSAVDGSPLGGFRGPNRDTLGLTTTTAGSALLLLFLKREHVI